ncbi:MAG: PQQ-binding-like beta-propeller repeat protein, partial [Candidatus Aenigmatarchaeota archaeon]
PSQGEFMFPQFDTSKPLLNPPDGTLVKKQLGDVEINYFSAAIIRGMSESGTDLFITLKNKGSGEASVTFPSGEEYVKDIPSCNLHFFAMQDSPVKIPAGGEKKLWYFTSIDQNACNFTVNFKFWLGSDEVNKVETPVKFGSVEDDTRGKETSVIYGYVKDQSGNPIRNARVDAMMNCGRMGNRADTDSQGRYVISVLAMEDINSYYGERELACDSKDYFISVIQEGYEYYFKEHVAPTRSEFVRLDITLEKEKEDVSYSLKWEKKVDDSYGFFWVKPSSDWTVFAADQAKHPPELNKATNFYLFDNQGNVLWKQPTGNECWGIDISADGKVTAGCHDKNVYVVDKTGKLLWSFDSGGMVRSACFSRDGKKVLSGALGTLYLFDSNSGTKTNVPWINEWFRNCQFYPDDSGFIVGSRTIGAFDSNANKLWQYVIGEFPMFLGVDLNKNVFASGKSRTLFSFDEDGNLRWKHRIPDHVAGAGSSTPDGSRIAIGTVGGMVYLFDGNGNLLWKRPTAGIGEQGGTVGHNAMAISSDGTRIVAGTAPGNCVIVYNEKGTALWKGCSEVQKTSGDMLEGVTNVQISPGKTEIVASYGDNYIREFVKK